MATNTDIQETQNNINLRDLLKMVDVDQLSKEEANQIFVRKCSEHTLVLSDVRPHRSRSIPMNEEYDDWGITKIISIFDMNTCSKFLRCFGCSVAKLRIQYSIDQTDFTHCGQLNRILKDNCADYLREIEFKFAPAKMLNNMTKPFQKVDTVKFFNCVLTGSLAEFNKYFPNMRRLELTEISKCIDNKCFITHYPNLDQDLTVPLFEGQWIKEQSVVDIFNSNPQLRSLHLLWFSAKFLRSISDHLQHIENLNLHFILKCSELNGEVIHFKAAKKLELMVMGLIDVKVVPFSFDQLDELILEVSAFDTVNSENIINFIIKHPTITKLKIHSRMLSSPFRSFFTNKENTQKIASGLPLLAEIDLNRWIFTLEEAVTFVAKCKCLMAFRFQLDDFGQFHALLERLGTEWQGNNICIFEIPYVSLRKTLPC